MTHRKKDPQIWHCSVRNFPWSDMRQCLASAPTTPTLPRFHKNAPPIVAPKPRRPPVNPAMYSYRSGLGSEYQIEHFKPPSPDASRPVPPIPAAAPPLQRTRDTTTSFVVPSLYPQHMQSAISLQHASPSHTPPPPQPPTQTHQLPPSPPPLGDWPRRDAVAQPLRIKRKSTRSTAASDFPPVGTPPPNSFPPRTRPTGPRTRSSSNGESSRPPPLDLSNVGSYVNSSHRRP